MTEYSVGEVRALSCELRASGDNLPSANDCNKAADMLTAFAERIAADDGAVVVAHRFLGPDGGAVTEWDDGMPDNGKVFPHLCPPVASVQYAYAHPPAQAAQADKPPRLGGCCCGEPCTLGVVHRTDGPCFRYADPAAHPTTNSPETDSKLVGEPVAQGEVVDIDTIALRAAEEIALMWGQDRSQFVAKIQVRIIAALQRVHAAPHFRDTNTLAEWLESLHECHTDGAVGSRKWEPAQIAAKAIHEPAQPAELPEFLKDPANVHAMMLRGAIAIPSIRSMVDLRGEVPNGEDAQLARIAELQEQVAALEAQPAERDEMSPDFTDSARAAITWVLYHHQGGSSPIGQPLRFALGMGASERLPDWRIAEAKRWAQQTGATTDRFHQPAERMVEGKLVGYVWPGKADYDYIHRCMGKDGDPEARRIPGGAVGVYAPLTAAQDADR